MPRGPSYYACAKKVATDPRVWKAIKTIKGMLNVEHKYYDTVPFSGASIDSSGTVAAGTMNLVQGDGGTTRDGDQVKAKSIYLQFNTEKHASSTGTELRIIVGLDFRPEGAPPTVADVLNSASVLSAMNMDHRRRFKILRDWRTILSDATATKLTKKWYFPLGKKSRGRRGRRLGLRLNFAGSTTDEPQNVNIFILAISDEATNTPSLSMISRVRFVDN